MRFTLSMILAPALLFSVIGCQAPRPSGAPNELRVAVRDYDAFIDATLTILREQHFQPQQVDREAGRIAAGPATGAQWFEFWRSDSQGPYQLLESSLHTIKRVVTINIEPLGPLSDVDAAAPLVTESTAEQAEPVGGCYRVAVRVDKSRYSAPERQVTTASGALAIYSERLPTTEGLRAARARGEHWVPLGRDELLEAYLLALLADAVPMIELPDFPPATN